MYKKITVLTVILFSVLSGFAQQKSFWAAVSADRAAASGKVKELFTEHGGMHYSLHKDGLKTVLAVAPERFSGNEGVVIGFPDMYGTTEYFTVYEYSNFSTDLQAQFPDIRAYAGFGIENPSSQLRFSFSPKGLQAMIIRPDQATEFIEPYTTDAGVYIAFTSSDKKNSGAQPFTCFTTDSHTGHNNLKNNDPVAFSSNMVLKKFRLALSCTAEYTAYHGGTIPDALAAMNATMTRVNGVYEKDLAVKLELISNTVNLIYTNAATDPYSNAAQGAGWQSSWSYELQANLNSTIGNNNYDMGHLFGATGGGGFSGCIGCVCSSGKGSGYTSPNNAIPESDTFDIDYVAHEMGHQLGANHTYSVDNEDTGVNIEPGSGSTIMGYAGITGNTDVQEHSDDYFAYRSIQQIQDNLVNKTCPVAIPLSNPGMVINAGSDYTIPKGTAFILMAAGAEANNAAVTYNWEQNDNVTNITTGSNSSVFPTKTAGPTFRSVVPSASPNRYMPKLATVLNNSLTANWETVSTVARELNFTLTGRDNIAGGGQTKTDAMTVTVSNGAGPFTVSSQNTANITWANGSTQTIAWNVAGTTGGNVNTANVNILLSTDGGLTFTIPLAVNTPNDGTETITVPDVQLAAAQCRIMVAAVNNIYYAVNKNVFTVTGTAGTDTIAIQNFIVYPNPSNGIFTVQLQGTGNAVTIAVHDIRGRQVYNQNVTPTGTFSQAVNLAGAEAGVYLITVQEGGNKTTKKIVVR